MLLDIGLIDRDYVWSLNSGMVGRLSHYRLSDNYLRFYLKYLDKYKEQIRLGQFTQQSINTLPGWDIIVGLQFENLVLANRSWLHEQLNISPSDIVMANPYFQRKTRKQQGCQIDYMIQTKQNLLYICEIKFSRNPLSGSVIDAVKEKIKRMLLPKGFVTLPVLIHVNGVSDAIAEHDYFAHVVNYADVLR